MSEKKCGSCQACNVCETCYTCQLCVGGDVRYPGELKYGKPASVEKFLRAEKRKNFLIYLFTFKWIKFK